MSETNERGNESLPQGTQLPVVTSPSPTCPAAAKAGCSACGKCRQKAATEDTSSGSSTAPAKQDGQQH
jgi:hypothetical protein